MYHTKYSFRFTDFNKKERIKCWFFAAFLIDKLMAYELKDSIDEFDEKYINIVFSIYKTQVVH